MGLYRTPSEPTCPFTYLLEETHLFLKTHIEKDTPFQMEKSWVILFSFILDIIT